MQISFKELKIGQVYERPFLAELWGYQGFQAISRGVVTPSKTNVIILFVTKEKQESLTQYNDYIDGKTLHWEGENKHTSDNRIVNAQANHDEIYLFYRDIHHTPFVYYGEIVLEDYHLNETEPSEFVFKIGKQQPDFDVVQDSELNESNYKLPDNTDASAITKSRIGQGVFRDRVIRLWGSCSVTGLRNISLLKASHIKPWRDSTNKERLDPMNGLLLQPNLDHLFDSGMITFDQNGRIIISTCLSDDDIKKMNLSSDIKLRKCPSALMDYMEYHRNNVFNGF